MPTVIDFQKMAYGYVPFIVFIFDYWENVLNDTVVNRMKVPNIQRIVGICQVWIKKRREYTKTLNSSAAKIV